MKKPYFASYLCVSTAAILDPVGLKGSDAPLEEKEKKEMRPSSVKIWKGTWTAIKGEFRCLNGWDVAELPVKRRLAYWTKQQSVTGAVPCL